MYTQQVTIINEQGMHMRPAQLLTDKASQFESTIMLVVNGDEVDAKSILGLLGLGLEKGTVLTLSAEGSDEEAAVKALAELFEQGFGE